MEEAAVRIDVSGTSCPMTFVRVKLALEDLREGEVLEAVLNATDHPREVPPSVLADGHEILSMIPDGDRVRLRIRKRGEGP